MDPHIKMINFIDEMKEIFKFGEEQDFTMKWLDEEGKDSVFVGALSDSKLDPVQTLLIYTSSSNPQLISI
jgi:predicted ATPase